MILPEARQENSQRKFPTKTNRTGREKLFHRQKNADGGSATGARINFNLAVMRFDDAPDNGEAEAGAARLGRGEHGFEGARFLFGGHAAAGVLEFERHQRGLVGGQNGARTDGERAAFGHGFGGVQNQIEKRLLQLRGIAGDGRQISFQTANQFYVLVR